MVIREALRIEAPVPLPARMTVADTEVLRYRVPKGSLVAALPVFVHHMPEYWPEPERFDPMRFSPQRREDRTRRETLSSGNACHAVSAGGLTMFTR